MIRYLIKLRKNCTLQYDDASYNLVIPNFKRLCQPFLKWENREAGQMSFPAHPSFFLLSSNAAL